MLRRGNRVRMQTVFLQGVRRSIPQIPESSSSRGGMPESSSALESGRSGVYATADAFLASFGLASLQDLPPLREFTDLGPEDREAVAQLESEEDLRRQLSFEDYAVRRTLSELDRRVDEQLAAASPDPEPS